MPDTLPAPDLEALRLLDDRLRWLSAWTIHNANHLRPGVHGMLIFKMVVSLHDPLLAGDLTEDDAADAVWDLISKGILPCPEEATVAVAN